MLKLFKIREGLAYRKNQTVLERKRAIYLLEDYLRKDRPGTHREKVKTILLINFKNN